MNKPQNFPTDEFQTGIQEIQETLEKVKSTLPEDSPLHQIIQAVQGQGEEMMKKLKTGS
jgi:hypothetical protein